MDKLDNVIKYIFYIILSILGYVLAHNYGNLERQLTYLSEELISVRMQLVKLEAKMLDEERVREIIKLEKTQSNKIQ